VFTAPSYQANLSPQIQSIVNGYRGAPDLAMNAAINGGVLVYLGFFSGGAWGIIGGTSCATPETAGLVALADQAASDLVGQPVSVGQLNPYLYSMSRRDFHDIVSHTFGEVTIDNNALYFNQSVLAALGPLAVPPVPVPGYQTLEGFDLATGFGSPRAAFFVIDLANAVAANY
jgi:subtilase family serine protease